ncbi:MAG: hypothetical protein HWQ35_11145 [Nostoc sp. NMS1]|uniref:hypothetical protein n=1 Tax=unclassified Nostoc TaxID=2593658 RepID=UPI0025F399B1|nr:MULTISPECIES: hypothetical protein [unclassified Nostoc]MBN3907087.1 hypothetical protein [Nostoc sp. NMS1]
MPQDIACQNFRGHSFKGQNHEGASFSDVCNCSVNFTDTILIGANFKDTKAGLQKALFQILYVAIKRIFIIVLVLLFSWGYFIPASISSTISSSSEKVNIKNNTSQFKTKLDFVDNDEFYSKLTNHLKAGRAIEIITNYNNYSEFPDRFKKVFIPKLNNELSINTKLLIAYQIYSKSLTAKTQNITNSILGGAMLALGVEAFTIWPTLSLLHDSSQTQKEQNHNESIVVADDFDKLISNNSFDNMAVSTGASIIKTNNYRAVLAKVENGTFLKVLITPEAIS